MHNFWPTEFFKCKTYQADTNERRWKRLCYWTGQHCREIYHFYLPLMQQGVPEEITHMEQSYRTRDQRDTEHIFSACSICSTTSVFSLSQPIAFVFSNIQQRKSTICSASSIRGSDPCCSLWYDTDTINKNCTENRCNSDTAPRKGKKNPGPLLALKPFQVDESSPQSYKEKATGTILQYTVHFNNPQTYKSLSSESQQLPSASSFPSISLLLSPDPITHKWSSNIYLYFQKVWTHRSPSVNNL